MVLENEKVRSEKLYCVGYLKTLGKYILSQTVPASAWYNRYYEITKEQYDSFGSESLDEFANAHFVKINNKKTMTKDKFMEKSGISKQSYNSIDLWKFIMAFAVVALHIRPLENYNIDIVNKLYNIFTLMLSDALSPEPTTI